MLKPVKSSMSLAFFALSAVALAGNVTTALAQPSPAETTLVLCETPSQSIRIYHMAGDPLMRAYNRQDGVVWMNRTPVNTETLPEGTQHTNQFGEQTVTLFAHANGNDCTVQIGGNAPEPGRILASNQGHVQGSQASADPILNQARQFYPDPVAQLEADCQAPASLQGKSFRNEGEPLRASFICWSAANGQGERTGTWLGNLPLTENDPTFIQPFTCAAGNLACESQLSSLKALYPEQLEAAEFACSMKKGTLFFAPAGETTDIRCGFFATTFWDTNGDRSPENQDAVSVDVSVGKVVL